MLQYHTTMAQANKTKEPHNQCLKTSAWMTMQQLRGMINAFTSGSFLKQIPQAPSSLQKRTSSNINQTCSELLTALILQKGIQLDLYKDNFK